MINVTKTRLPDRKKLDAYIDRIYESGWATNRGELVQELERRLAEYLGVRNVVVVANGTLALQVAYRALELKGEVITTPFSFVATASSLAWEWLDVVFSDIDRKTWNIDPGLLERHIGERTSAIVPVHVFGNPCAVEEIAEIANERGLKVIYDAAHAFGVRYMGESILRHGDISTLSFHATKIFHSIEGGAIVTNDDALCARVREIINFGITGPESISFLGINAKMNEFEAAVGLCMLDEVEEEMRLRQKIAQYYDENLPSELIRQGVGDFVTRNYAYYPLVFPTKSALLRAQKDLIDSGIRPRRYFYPSLDTLSFINASGSLCSVSNDISGRILCIPMYGDLQGNVQEKIVEMINVDVKLW